MGMEKKKELFPYFFVVVIVVYSPVGRMLYEKEDSLK